jgi:hypothetical protein
MTTYRIESKAGANLGDYHGDTVEQAFEAFRSDVGDGIDEAGKSTVGTVDDYHISEVRFHVFYAPEGALEYFGCSDTYEGAVTQTEEAGEAGWELYPRSDWDTHRAAGQHWKAPPVSFDPDSDGDLDDLDWHHSCFIWQEVRPL